MKIYVTARYKGAENKAEIEALCQAVRESGNTDFCFVRDVENYQKVFHGPKELWERSLEEIRHCDALLIDVSDQPSGGRVVEAGIAYALNMPIFTVVHKGVSHKEVYDGISTTVIPYETYMDIAVALRPHAR